MLESVAAPLNFQRNRASLPLQLGGRSVMRHFQVELMILHFLFVGMVSAQVRPNARPSQIITVTTSSRDTVTVNLIIRSDVHVNRLSANIWQRRERQVDARDLRARKLSTGDANGDRHPTFEITSARSDAAAAPKNASTGSQVIEVPPVPAPEMILW